MKKWMESSVVFFPCHNQQETRDYYTNVLGLTIYQEKEGNLILDTGYGYLGFVEYGDDRPMATGVCISFNCESREQVDEVYQRIKDNPACGVKGAPQHHPRFPVYSFFFSDPNGYTLEFQKLD